jgi:hypothetical protein
LGKKWLRDFKEKMFFDDFTTMELHSQSSGYVTFRIASYLTLIPKLTTDEHTATGKCGVLGSAREMMCNRI